MKENIEAPSGARIGLSERRARPPRQPARPLDFSGISQCGEAFQQDLRKQRQFWSGRAP
jgi:hypothetical protein